MEKYKLSSKILNYFLNEKIYKWFADKIAHYPFCKKLSMRFYKKSKINEIKGMRELFKTIPIAEKNYHSKEYDCYIDMRIGYYYFEKKGGLKNDR